MNRGSVLIVSGAGFVIALVFVAGAIGAVMAYDELTGPTVTDVSLTRINDSHAAVAWTSEQPTNGTIEVSVRPETGGGTIDTVATDSERTRTHLVVVPIYDWNRSKVQQMGLDSGGTIRAFDLRVRVTDDGSDPYYESIVKCTRESSGDNQSELPCETVV